MKKLIQTCQEACDYLARHPSHVPASLRLQEDNALQVHADRITPLLNTCGEVYVPSTSPNTAPPETISAVTWNIERGKHFESLVASLKTNASLAAADIHLLTEVDWGMARSANRNVAAELGRALGRYAYYAPSYFNFTMGHGSERHLSGYNKVGLHGKAILSRYPLEDLRTAPMTNATDKLSSQEARLGQKRALVGHLRIGDKKIACVCVHLDAFSSPRTRASQIRELIGQLGNEDRALIGGDWNTNTLDTSNGLTTFLSVLRQLLLTGPQRIIRTHHPYPERRFDRVLFKTIRSLGFETEGFNEAGVGTYDLVNNDTELGQLASDEIPMWVLRWIDRQVEKSGGLITMKLDWFAARGLVPIDKKVIKLKPGIDHPAGDHPSDHHPVSVTARI